MMPLKSYKHYIEYESYITSLFIIVFSLFKFSLF
jgi:hypothetical protein